jgi:hypothetical protein
MNIIEGNIMLKYSLLSLFLFAMLMPASAQNNVVIAGEDASLRLGLTLQPRFTYAYEARPGDDLTRLEMGLRRFRLRTYVTWGDNMRLFAQLEGGGPTAQVLDLRAEYKLNKNFWLRMGRFVGAQPRAMAITLHSEIDAIDRAAIADLWTRATLGADARDYGIEMLYRKPTLEYRLFLHNGYNQANYRSGLADQSITGNQDQTRLSVSTMVRYFPETIDNAEAGAFAGVNRSRNPNTVNPAYPGIGRDVLSAAIHGYWGTFPGKQPIRVKFDAIAMKYEAIDVAGGGQFNQTFVGATLFAGMLVENATEVFIRSESFSRNIDESGGRTDMFTIGSTYSISAAAGGPFLNRKITVAYSFKKAENSSRIDHLVMAQLQIMI